MRFAALRLVRVWPMRTALAAMAMGLFLVLGSAQAAETVEGLYVGDAVVTGNLEGAERQRGFREALMQVLVKVSGDADLEAEPRLAALVEGAAALVSSFDYEDRLKKKLMHEQGTRDWSYILHVHFDPAAIDRTLAGLGRQLWSAERPRLLVLCRITDTVGPYVLGLESQRGQGQREVFLSLARRRAVPLVLPRLDPAEREGVDSAAPARLAGNVATALKAAYGADAVLLANMTTTSEGYWNTSWTLLPATGGTPQPPQPHWTLDRVTFDRAIAFGVERSARALAGLE